MLASWTARESVNVEEGARLGNGELRAPQREQAGASL
jgi:hypothetical protein